MSLSGTNLTICAINQPGNPRAYAQAYRVNGFGFIKASNMAAEVCSGPTAELNSFSLFEMRFASKLPYTFCISPEYDSITVSEF